MGWKEKAEQLKTLCVGVNANNGKENCGYVAERINEHLQHQKHLGGAPVPTESAGIYFDPHKTRKRGRIQIKRSYTENKLLLELCAPPSSSSTSSSSASERVDFTDEARGEIIEVDIEMGKDISKLKLIKTNAKEIVEQLKILPRGKDNCISGFLVLTHTYNTKKGHISNFHVDSENNVFFIDAQSQNENTWVLPLPPEGYRPELFYLPSVPLGGYKVKEEQSDSSESSPESPANGIKEEPSSEEMMDVFPSPPSSSTSTTVSASVSSSTSSSTSVSESVSQLAENLWSLTRKSTQQYIEELEKVPTHQKAALFSYKGKKSTTLMDIAEWVPERVPSVLETLKKTLAKKELLELLMFRKASGKSFITLIAQFGPEYLVSIFETLQKTLSQEELFTLLTTKNSQKSTFLMITGPFKGYPYLAPILETLQKLLTKEQLFKLLIMQNKFGSTFLTALVQYRSITPILKILKQMLTTEELVKLLKIRTKTGQTCFMRLRRHMRQQCKDRPVLAAIAKILQEPEYAQLREELVDPLPRTLTPPAAVPFTPMSSSAVSSSTGLYPLLPGAYSMTSSTASIPSTTTTSSSSASFNSANDREQPPVKKQRTDFLTDLKELRTLLESEKAKNKTLTEEIESLRKELAATKKGGRSALTSSSSTTSNVPLLFSPPNFLTLTIKRPFDSTAASVSTSTNGNGVTHKRKFADTTSSAE